MDKAIDNNKRLDRFLGLILKPVSISYSLFRKVIDRTKRSAPYLYDEVESLIKSQLISFDKDKKTMHSPDIAGISDTITSNLMRKLPNLDDKAINSMVKDSSAMSFLDLLTRGLGTLEAERDFTVISKEKIYKKILIANRGEIALRIIRACRELNIKVAVVYTKSDKNSLAVKFADQSIYIGNNVKDYLGIKKLVKIARKIKADAIHPGYGFLAENSEFAKLCERNKIKFIGPSVKSLCLMGDKISAKSAIVKDGIPVISGTRKKLINVKDAIRAAKKMGYPIIIKAAAGGGGKGMRVVRNKHELKSAFFSAQNEAQLSFGDNSLFIEKYVEDPRHIEFQILADRYGNVIHLGERECSIQRRHQKLIEEAPSPALNKKLRERMGNIAVQVAKMCGYEGAGTVEFLLDTSNNFFFMEMNTRIQVEHGITEMITGVDLIKEQIKIAAGAKLAYTQEDIKINSWAVECRINAEDPLHDFSPSVGEITEYLPPGGPGIRVCSSCHTGHIIDPQYDSMIAKLICGGKTRNEAIARMKRALDEYIIEGVETTIPFHKIVLNNKQFLKGRLSTSFIENNRIIEELKKIRKTKKKELSKEKKLVIVSTAATKYLEKRSSAAKLNDWVMAGRQEMMQER